METELQTHSENQKDVLEATELLKYELEQRKKRNPRYSLRAFSQYLELSPAQLSQLLSGKRPFTIETLTLISEKLHLSPLESERLVTETLWRKIDPRRSANQNEEVRQLEEDQFQMVASWVSIAILSLAKKSKAKNSASWVAAQLGVSESEAAICLERLQRLGLIATGPELKRLTSKIHQKSPTPSPAIQRFHRGLLDLAERKLASVAVENRDYSALIFLADAKKVEKARKLIQDFQDQLADLMKNPNQEGQVYAVSCQLFPIEVEP